MIEKVIRNGRVGVLISPDFGAGWSSWADESVAEHLLYEPEVVYWIERGRTGPEPDMEAKYPGFYGTAVGDLIVEWVPVGTRFRVHEYDGSERLVLESNEVWFTA